MDANGREYNKYSRPHPPARVPAIHGSFFSSAASYGRHSLEPPEPPEASGTSETPGSSRGLKHGYSILKDVQQLSDGRIVLSTGTLYGALKRLLEQRWIAREDDVAADTTGGRGQKVYTLTEPGRRVLAAETARRRSLVRVAAGRQVITEP